jgi:signal peptide peptidase SppA
MKLLDIVTAPWAIIPDRLAEIQDLYARHLKGDKIDIEGIRAQLGLPRGELPAYDIVNRVAIIPVIDIIAKRMNFLMRIFGGTSTEMTGRLIHQALSDPDVDAIVLEVDSPGGTVDGTSELAKLIYAARGKKPMVTWANGLMASAGVWIGSATDQTYIAGDTTQVGSIGVLTRHVDISQFEADIGVKTTLIYAGKYKVIGHPYQPLSKDHAAVIQGEIDYLYSIFVDAVAKHRGATVANVLETMAEGRMFIGQQAVDAGLVDGVATLDDVIAALTDGDIRALNTTTALTRAQTQRLITHLEHETNREGTTMPAEKIEITKGAVLEHAPDIAEAFRAEGRASVDVDTVKTAAATAERERIKAVFEQSMPGHEKLIDQLAFDGKTSGPEAAVQILKAINAKKADHAQAIQKDGEELLTVKASADGDANVQLSQASKEQKDKSKEKDFETLVAEQVAAGKKRSDAIRDVVRNHPKAHAAYIAKANAPAA